MKETDKKTKRKISIFNITLLILLAAGVVFLFFGYKFAKNKVMFLLSNPTDLGAVTIIPQEFEGDFPFKYAWKSVRIKFTQGTDLFFENPRILLDPKLTTRRELLNISIDSIYANIVPGESTKDSTKIDDISHPDLWLPFRVSINVNKAAVNVKEIGNWNLDSLVAAKSGRQKRIYIRAKDIRGTHLARNLFLNAEYRWNQLFADAFISISDKTSDSLTFMLNAPRLRLEDLSGEIDANVANLSFWLNDKWPKEAPKIEKINLHSNVSVNILTGKADFDLSLKTKIGKFWQLPAFDATITVLGNNSGISQSEIFLKGNNGEIVLFKGNVDKNLDGGGELEIKGINITLGHETLPTDVKFNKITKKGNSASTSFTTGAGSNFTANMADLNNPIITFSADISPEEPWAVQWCGDMLKLASPTILTGSFSFKQILLNANLKTKVPYAYYAAADEFDVSLWLDPEGIRFPKGTIKRKGYESDFTGEVMWSKEYFTFKLNQPGGGEAEVYGKFSPKIDLALNNINTLELPFADTAMLKGYNGFVSGNWLHDFQGKNGSASVSLSTTIRNFTVSAKADIEMHGDSLIAKRIEVEQNEKKIEGSLFALLPSETRKDLDVQRANLNIAEMNLVSLLAMFNDSTLLSGYANGNLEYNGKMGLRGEIAFTQIELAGLDSNIARFPNLYLEANGDSVKISSRVFLGYEGLWNGTLKAVMSKPKEKNDFPFYVSYAASNIDNKGELLFDGFLSKDFKNVFGKIMVQGDWFLPSGMGEIKNADINIDARTILGKNVLDSLTADFSTGQNIYEMEIFKIPFTFSGRIRRGTLFVNPILIYGQNDEKVTATLQFDLKKANITDLSFNTKQFTLTLLNDHLIQIKNLTGRTELDSSGVTVFADLPSIYYNMKNADYGTVEATLKGQAIYKLPIQTGQSQTNPSITGNFEIGKANYQKTLDIIPDPLHIDKAWKNLNRFLASLRKEKKGSSIDRSALTSRPTTLDIKIQTGRETALVNTSVAEFGFVVDVSVTGTTRNILLFGDINAIGGGKVGHKDLTMFDLSSFRLYWQASPIRQGEIDLRLSNEYPFCTGENETCSIFIDVTGSLAKLNLQPTANCDIEASPALIYYSMLLGCISRDYESGINIDRDRALGKVVGKTMSSTINSIVGGNVVGDIDFKWRFLNDTPQEEDTNYVRVPISLSKWVENLDFVLGYTNTNENSLNPRYDKSYEVGFRYRLPVFDSTDINRNLIDPSLDISANLVARDYISTLETNENETRLEAKIGLAYRHKFWDPCILGIGYCKMAGN